MATTRELITTLKIQTDEAKKSLADIKKETDASIIKPAEEIKKSTKELDKLRQEMWDREFKRLQEEAKARKDVNAQVDQSKKGAQGMDQTFKKLGAAANPAAGAVNSLGGALASGTATAQGFAGAATGVLGSLGPWGAAAAAALSAITALITGTESAADKAKRLREQYDAFTETQQGAADAAKQLADILAQPAPDTGAALALINQHMAELKELSPGVAHTIEAMLSIPGGPTVDTLRDVEDLMGRINDKAQQDAVVQLGATVEAEAKTFRDSFRENLDTMLKGYNGTTSKMLEALTAINQGTAAGLDGALHAQDTLTKALDNQAQLVAGRHAQDLATLDLEKEKEKVIRDQARALVGVTDQQLAFTEAQGDILGEAAEQREQIAQAEELLRKQVDSAFEQLEAQQKIAQQAADINTEQGQRVMLEKTITDVIGAEGKAQVDALLATEDTRKTKLDQLKATRANLVALQGELKAEIAKYTAIAQGESAHIELKGQLAEAAAEVARMEGKSVQANTASFKADQSKLKALQNELGRVTAAIGEVDKQIAAAQGGGHRSGGGGAKAAGKSPAEQEGEKAAEALKKAMDDYRKAIESAEKSYRDAMQKLREQRAAEESKLRIDTFNAGRDVLKAMNDRADAEKALMEHLEDFATKLQDGSAKFVADQFKNISSIAAGYLNEVERSAAAFRELVQSQLAYKEQLAAAVDQNKLLAARQQDTATTAREREQALARDLAEAADATDAARRAMNALAEQLPEATRDAAIRAAQQQATQAQTPAAGTASSGPGMPTETEVQAALSNYRNLREADAKRILGVAQATWRNYQQLEDLLKKRLQEVQTAARNAGPPPGLAQDQAAILGSNRRASGGAGNSPEEIGARLTTATLRFNEAQAAQNRLITDHNAAMTAAQTAAANLAKTRDELALQEEALADTEADRISILADIAFKLNALYAQQKKIADLEAEQAQTTDPIRRKELENRIELEKHINAGLEEQYGTAEGLVDQYTKMASKNADIDTIISRGSAKRISDLDQIHTLLEKNAAIQSDIADLNEQLSEQESNALSRAGNQLGSSVANLATARKNLVIQQQIAEKLEKQRQTVTQLAAEARRTLSDPAITADEYNRVNGELADYRKQLVDIRNEQEANGTATTAATQAAEDAQKQLVTDTITTLTAIYTALEKGILTFTDSTKTAAEKVGAVTEGLSSIASQFGPIGQAVGGAIAAVGGTVQKIVEALFGREKTIEEVAQDRAATEELILNTYRLQLDVLKTLEGLHSSSADSARERLDWIEREHEELIGQSDEMARVAAMATSTLAAEKARLAMLKAQTDETIRQGEEVQEQGRKARREWLEAHGIEVKAGDNTKRMIRDYLAQQKALGILTDAQLKAAETELGFRQEEIDLTRQLRAEEAGRLDVQERLALRANDYAAALGRANKAFGDTRRALNKGIFSALGIDAAGLDDQQLSDFIRGLGKDAWQKLGEENQALIDQWLSGWEALGDAELEDAENLIELRRDAGVIDQQTAKEQLLDLYTAELQRLTEINASEEEKLAIQIKINDLTKEENADLDKQNSKLAKLVDQRQKDYLAKRGSSVAALNQQIRAELERQGFDEDYISAFMRTLPGFAEGGVVGETGPIMAHGKPGEPEFMMSGPAVSAYGVDFMKQLNNLQIPRASMGSLGARIMERNVTQNVSVSVQNTFNNPQGPREAYAVAGVQFEKAIKGIVRDAFGDRSLNPRVGGL